MPLPKSMIEAELPARAQQGDENALAALIARMMPPTVRPRAWILTMLCRRG